MNKKIAIFFLVSGFFTAPLPMHTLAAKQAADDELLGETLMLMKMDRETMDRSGDLSTALLPSPLLPLNPRMKC